MGQYHIPRLIPYGTIRRSHGHQGAMTIELHSEELMDAEPQYLFIDIDGIPVPFHVEEMRGTREQLITAVERIDSSDAATLLRGRPVWIGADEAPQIEEGDVSIHLLLGYSVEHTSGCLIGVITEIEDSTANVLLVISDERREDQNPLLIPYVEEWIQELDTTRRVLTLSCPAELLDLQ